MGQTQELKDLIEVSKQKGKKAEEVYKELYSAKDFSDVFFVLWTKIHLAAFTGRQKLALRKCC